MSKEAPVVPRRCLSLCFILVVAALASTAGVASAAVPANDTFAGRTTISSLPFTDTVDTSEATADADDAEVATACEFSGSHEASVWYSYSPDTSREVRIDASGSSYTTGVGVVIGSPGGFQRYICFSGSSRFWLSPGETFHVVVSDISGGHGGTLRLSVDEPRPPTVKLDVDDTGTATKAGVGIVGGTVTCTRNASGYLNGSLSQAVGRVSTIAGNGYSYPTCDGTPQPWTMEVPPNGGKFAGGKAKVHVWSDVYNEDGGNHDEVTKTITLRR